jgi:hypothetical protein
MENIDTKKLVAHIKEAEIMRRLGKWEKYTKESGLGKQFHQWWPDRYETHVTGLYTLRAWLRGRMHRKNPPAPIRDFNRTMEEQGRASRMEWNMEDHNRKIAEEAAKRYLHSADNKDDIIEEPAQPQERG